MAAHSADFNEASKLVFQIGIPVLYIGQYAVRVKLRYKHKLNVE
jgi:hypothetical protein